MVRDPYARWCERGGAARLPPIPIILQKPNLGAFIESCIRLWSEAVLGLGQINGLNRIVGYLTSHVADHFLLKVSLAVS